MTLQSAIDGELPFLQVEALARMTDTCIITKPGAGVRGPINPVTFQYDAAPGDITVYEGVCRLGRVEIPHVSQATSGDATWDTQDAVLHIALDGSEAVGAGQTVTYLTSSRNPALVGKVFGILGVVSGSDLTARRCLVREVVAD